MTQPLEWANYQGRSLYDQDDAVVGVIEEFYIDREGGDAVWVCIYPGEPTTQRSFVPLRDARPRGAGGEDLQVSVGADEIRNAPTADAGRELSGAEERRLYEHYDMPYPGQEAAASATTPGTGDKPAAGDKPATGGRPETGEQHREHHPGLLQRLLGRVTHHEEAPRPREKVEKTV